MVKRAFSWLKPVSVILRHVRSFLWPIREITFIWFPVCTYAIFVVVHFIILLFVFLFGVEEKGTFFPCVFGLSLSRFSPSYVRLWIMICLANGFLSSLRHTTNYIELIVAATPNLFLLFKWQNQKLLHVHIHEKEKKAYTNDWKNDSQHNQTDLNRAPTKQLNDILFCVCSEFLCLIHRHKRKKKNQIWILKS